MKNYVFKATIDMVVRCETIEEFNAIIIEFNDGVRDLIKDIGAKRVNAETFTLDSIDQDLL